MIKANAYRCEILVCEQKVGDGAKKPISKRGWGAKLKKNCFFFFKREKDAECSKNLVIINILSKTYVRDHSGSLDMHIGKR